MRRMLRKLGMRGHFLNLTNDIGTQTTAKVGQSDKVGTFP